MFDSVQEYWINSIGVLASILLCILFNGTIVSTYCDGMSSQRRRKPTNILLANLSLTLLVTTAPWCVWLVCLRDGFRDEFADVKSKVDLVVKVTAYTHVALFYPAACLTADRLIAVCSKLKTLATWTVPFVPVILVIVHVCSHEEIYSDARVVSIVVILFAITGVMGYSLAARYRSSSSDETEGDEPTPPKDDDVSEARHYRFGIAITVLSIATFLPSVLCSDGKFHRFSVLSVELRLLYSVVHPLIVMYFMEDFRQQNQLLDFCRKLGRGASLGYQNEKETMEKIQINS